MEIYKKQEKTLTVIFQEEDIKEEENLQEMIKNILQFFNIEADCKVEWTESYNKKIMTIVQEIFNKGQ